MGSQDRNEGRIRTEIFQNLQSHTNGTNQTGQILKGQPRQRIHSTIEIPYGITFLFRYQERRKTTTLPRLSIPKRLDNQKCISSTTDLGNYGQTQRRKILH